MLRVFFYFPIPHVLYHTNLRNMARFSYLYSIHFILNDNIHILFILKNKKFQNNCQIYCKEQKNVLFPCFLGCSLSCSECTVTVFLLLAIHFSDTSRLLFVHNRLIAEKTTNISLTFSLAKCNKHTNVIGTLRLSAICADTLFGSSDRSEVNEMVLSIDMLS